MEVVTRRKMEKLDLYVIESYVRKSLVKILGKRFVNKKSYNDWLEKAERYFSVVSIFVYVNHLPATQPHAVPLYCSSYCTTNYKKVERPRNEELGKQTI